MRNKISLFALTTILIAVQAIAQTPEKKPEAPPVASSVPSASAPATSAVPAAAPATSASTVAAPVAPPIATDAPPAEAAIPSYFRIDHDYVFGLQLWAGAIHPLINGVGLATDIIMTEGQLPAYQGATSSWYGEFDIGPSFTFGPLSLTPMTGAGFDWAAKHMMISNEQLYTILNTNKIYIESWIWAMMYSPFKEAPSPNVFHTRDWILYKLSGTLSIGPQLEIWANMKSKTVSGLYLKNGTTSMPIGGHLDIAYGTGNTLGIFLGYENKDGRAARNGNATVGRFTFIHNF